MSQPSPSEGDRRDEGHEGTAWPSERVKARQDAADGGTRPDGSTAVERASRTEPGTGPGHAAAGSVSERGTEPVETTAGADGPTDLRTLFLDDDDAGDLISSLSSETARSILVRLHDGAATASEVAESVDTSVQNVRHHLDSLTEAGLVHVADTRYSSKGREMDVYAPVDEPLVVFVGSGEDTGGSGFVDSLKRFLGAIGLLGGASLLLQWALWSAGDAGTGGIVRIQDGLAGGATGLGIPAGLLFFAGGALMLAVVSAWRYHQRTGA